ncbi:MAG TPA: pseudouridylate synthase [Mucilaginibacter sp.]|nr:pseudouridylate synthase [Mucilaginibacter sp.]
MAFKRPGSSRNDQSGRSSNRASKSADAPKRSTSRGRSSSGADKTDFNKPAKKYSSERSGEKRSFSSSGSKPFQGRQSDGDKPASSFTGGSSGEKKSFSPRSRPYTGRPADNDDRPKRSFGGEPSGEKRSFAPKSRPYTGRIADNDERPKRSFGDKPGGEKRAFSPKGKPFSERPNDDRPKRSFDGPSDGKKSFAPRSKSSTGPFNSDDRPKKSYGSDKAGERKSAGRPSASGGFKKHDGDRPYSADRPQRSRSTYDKISPDQDAPAKTLRGRKKGPESKDSGLIRLNRYISNAGICSRRKADELIEAGVVSVNGVVVSELGHKVDPQKDEIRYNGELLKREKMVYVLLNKPKDYITTTEDPQERRTVMHLVEKASKERIYPIGRLDRNTTGLLLMTNDGDLADKLSHPRNSIVKLYQVELNKSLTQGDLNKISYGLELEDGLIKPDSISYVSGGSKREVGIQIHSGKNRIVRRIFEHLGYEVVKLDRAVYANLTKKDLPRGRWRFLEESEVIQLKHLI